MAKHRGRRRLLPSKLHVALAYGALGAMTIATIGVAAPRDTGGNTSVEWPSAEQIVSATNRASSFSPGRTLERSTSGISGDASATESAQSDKTAKSAPSAAAKRRAAAAKPAAPKETTYLAGLSGDRARERLADARYAARFTKASRGTLRGVTQEYGKRFGTATSSTSTSLPGSNAVHLEQVGQVVSSWCGPATAYMIIDQLKRDGKISTTNSAGGASLSQSALASSRYVNAGGGTYRDDLKDGLNKWLGKNLFSVRENLTPQQFMASVTQDIDSGRAVAVATTEPAGSIHYNNHPRGLTIGHWIAARGYSDNGRVTQFADPATTIWSASNRYFSYPSAAFVEQYLQPDDKAIVW